MWILQSSGELRRGERTCMNKYCYSLFSFYKMATEAKPNNVMKDKVSALKEKKKIQEKDEVWRESRESSVFVVLTDMSEIPTACLFLLHCWLHGVNPPNTRAGRIPLADEPLLISQ